MALSGQLIFFGRSGGVVTAVQAVSRALQLPINIHATENLSEVAAALRTGPKAALAGPLNLDAKRRSQLVRELDLHTRIFRGFGAARIPKHAAQDLFQDFDVNIVAMSNADTNPPPGEISLMEKLELAERLSTLELATQLSTKSLKEAAAVALKSPNRTVTVAFKEGFQISLQESVMTAFNDLVQPRTEDKYPGIPISSRAQRPASLANELIMFPDRIGTVFLPPLTFADEICHLVEGILGGASLANWTWKGDHGDLYHTGDFKDGDKANPTGALLAFCSLLAQNGQGSAANALYNSVRAVAAKQDTYLLAETEGVNGFAQAVISQLNSRKQ